MEVLISWALINSYISHDELVLVNIVHREYDDTKKEIKNLKPSKVHQRFSYIHKTMLSYCLKCRKIQKEKTQKL